MDYDYQKSKCKRFYKGVERLLVEVNNLHQKLRPDIFIENAVKYDEKKFDEIISNDSTPVFVAVDDEGNVLGHLFCSVRDYVQVKVYKDFKSLFIDDLCVEEGARGTRRRQGFVRICRRLRSRKRVL